MPSTLIFGLQHHLVRIYLIHSFGAQGLLNGPTYELARSLLESSWLTPQGIEH